MTPEHWKAILTLITGAGIGYQYWKLQRKIEDLSALDLIIEQKYPDAHKEGAGPPDCECHKIFVLSIASFPIHVGFTYHCDHLQFTVVKNDHNDRNDGIDPRWIEGLTEEQRKNADTLTSLTEEQIPAVIGIQLNSVLLIKIASKIDDSSVTYNIGILTSTDDAYSVQCKDVSMLNDAWSNIIKMLMDSKRAADSRSVTGDID